MPCFRHAPTRVATALMTGLLAALALSACGGGSNRTPGPALPSGHDNLISIFEAEGPLRQDPHGTIALLQSLGVQRIRFYLQWASVAPDPDSRHSPAHFDAADPAAYPAANWAYYDQIIEDAHGAGIGIDLTVGSNAPRWAAGPGAPRNAYSVNWEPSARDFGAFMHAVGERYSGHYKPPGQATPLPKVSFWAIWNEPNYGHYLSPQTVDNSTVETSPRIYRGLLDAAWSSLAATGHTARTDTVLIGETAPRGITLAGYPGSFSGMVPLRFIRALYCIGANFKPLKGTAASLRGCPSTAAASARFAAENPALFEAAGFADHPYPDEGSPTFRTPNEPDYADFAALGNLETTLDRAAAAYGRSLRLPIYSTEFGYRTDPPSSLGVPYATAARYLNEAEYLSWRDPRIRSYDQYLLEDPPPTQRSDFVTGIESSDGRPKPDVFAAYRMPLYLPVTTAARKTELLVWGCVRSAPPVARATHHGQSVAIEFAPLGGGAYQTVDRVPLAANANGYFVTRVTFPGTGTVRLAWRDGRHTLYSRTQPITLH